MKHIKVIAFAIFIFIFGLVFNFSDFSTTLKTIPVGNIDTINIASDYSIVNFALGNNEEILVEINTSFVSNKNQTFYSYIEENTLFIEPNIKEEAGFFKNQNEITIYIPDEMIFETLNYNVDQGKLTINNLVINTINIKSEEIVVNIFDNSFDTINLESDFATFKLYQAVGNVINFNASNGLVQLNRSTIDTSLFNFNNEGIFNFNNSVIKLLTLTGNNITSSLSLTTANNYKIFTDEIINNQNLEKVSTFYQTIVPNENKITNEIHLGTAKISGFTMIEE